MCRFSRDPTMPLVRVVWYFTDLDFQKFDSAINMRIWDSDDTRRLDIGEDFLDPRQAPYRHKVTGLDGKHQCGPDAWFLDGQPVDASGPPVEYDGQLIPLCCRQPNDPPQGGVEIGGAAGDYATHVDPTSGGLAMGGRAADAATFIDPTAGGLELGGSVVPVDNDTDPTAGGLELGGAAGDVGGYSDPAAGGLELGGSAGDVGEHTDPAAGGLELGGSAGDVYDPGAPIPGTSCSTTGNALHNHDYSGDFFSPSVQWYKFQISSAGTYTFHYNSGGAGPAGIMIFWGSSCANLTSGQTVFDGIPANFTPAAGDIVAFDIATFYPGIIYTIKLTP